MLLDWWNWLAFNEVIASRQSSHYRRYTMLFKHRFSIIAIAAICLLSSSASNAHGQSVVYRQVFTTPHVVYQTSTSYIPTRTALPSVYTPIVTNRIVTSPWCQQAPNVVYYRHSIQPHIPRKIQPHIPRMMQEKCQEVRSTMAGRYTITDSQSGLVLMDNQKQKAYLMGNGQWVELPSFPR